MLKILLVSHGDFCSGLLASYQMIVGETEGMSWIKLDELGIGAFSQKLTTFVEEAIEENQVLVLTDIKGGTPFNEAYRLFLHYPEKMRVITGMNLPMLIELGMNAKGTELGQLDGLVTLGINTGKDSIEGIQLEEIEEDVIDF